MTRYLVTISSHDRDLMLDLVRKFKVQVFDHGVRQTPEEGYIVHAVAEDQSINELATKGYKITRNYDIDSAGKLRQAEVARTSKYLKTIDQAMDFSPENLANSCLNVEQVESAVKQSAASPSCCTS